MNLNDDMQAAAPPQTSVAPDDAAAPAADTPASHDAFPPAADGVIATDAPALPSEPSAPSVPSAPALPAGPSAWDNMRTFVRETVETIALTLIIFLVIRAGVQNFRIEGSSMEPNFHDGQYLLVSKVDYMLGKPQRGDVVVFIAPTNQEKDFIKRVIGLPGETVEIREGRVSVNGRELPTNYPLNAGTYSYGPATVGENELFVLGDNRNYSSDSHSWGMLPAKDLIGRAWISYWPPQQWGVVQTPSFGEVPTPAPAAAPAQNAPTRAPAAPQPTMTPASYP